MKSAFSLRDEFKREKGMEVSCYDNIPAYADWLEDKLLEKENSNVPEMNGNAVLSKVREIVERAWSQIVWKSDEIDLFKTIEELHDLLS